MRIRIRTLSLSGFDSKFQEKISYDKLSISTLVSGTGTGSGIDFIGSNFGGTGVNMAIVLIGALASRPKS
jgi:hypothetical protein